MVRNERIMPPAFCRQRYPSIPTPRTPRDMITAEYATTVRVTGTVFANSSVTGFPVPREIPKSMWSASTTQSKYCTGSGLSRPSMTRASSICSWVTMAELRFTYAVAGSMGERRISRKERSVTTNKVSRTTTTLRMR